MVAPTRWVMMIALAWLVPAQSAPLNKYQTSGPQVVEQVPRPQIQGAPPPVIREPQGATEGSALNMELVNPDSPIYSRNRRILADLELEKLKKWLAVYRDKMESARRENRTDEFVYYLNMVRIAEDEVNSR